MSKSRNIALIVMTIYEKYILKTSPSLGQLCLRDHFICRNGSIETDFSLLIKIGACSWRERYFVFKQRCRWYIVWRVNC